jgi:precorrin-6B methylase 2
LTVAAKRALGRVQERDFLPRKATLVDVGANGGQSALAMSLVCPCATIVSFEANEKNISDLRLIQRILDTVFIMSRYPILAERACSRCR